MFFLMFLCTDIKIKKYIYKKKLIYFFIKKKPILKITVYQS